MIVSSFPDAPLMTSYDSVLLVAHGDKAGDNGMTEHNAESLGLLTGVPVRCAYRRYSMKRVRPAMERLAADGFRSTAIVPLFLSENMYTRSIPKAMGLMSEDRDGVYTNDGASVRFHITPPLGDDPAAAETIAGIAASRPGCGAVLVGKMSGKLPDKGIEMRSMELIERRGIPVAWCSDPDDPQAGRAAMDALGTRNAVFIPVSFSRGVSYAIEGAEMLPPFGQGPWIPHLIKGILDRETVRAGAS